MAELPLLLRTLSDVLGALERLDVRHVLVGGLALAVWIEPRATVDIDIVVAVDDAGFGALAADLAREVEGVVSARPARFRDGTRLARVIVPRDGAETLVDLLRINPDFVTSVMARRVRARPAGIQASIAAPEDLIVMKLIAGRPRDLVDARALANLDGLDRAYVRSWARRLRVLTRLARVATWARRPSR